MSLEGRVSSGVFGLGSVLSFTLLVWCLTLLSVAFVERRLWQTFGNILNLNELDLCGEISLYESQLIVCLSVEDYLGFYKRVGLCCGLFLGGTKVNRAN